MSLLDFVWSGKPRDKEHPYGHGRAETVIGLIISIILIVVGLEVAKSGVGRLIAPQAISGPIWLAGLVMITIIIKAWLAYFTFVLARTINSTALKADAWNHTFDILSTTLVLVAIFCSRFGWYRIDGWAALCVAGFIIYTGITYAKSTIYTLVGEAPSYKDIKLIKQTAISVEGIQSVHDVIIHEYGDLKIISFHIEVDAHMTALECHELTEAAERIVSETFNAKVMVHADPIDRSHPDYGNIEREIQRIIKETPILIGFHDLRVSGNDKLTICVDLVVKEKAQLEQFEQLLNTLHPVFFNYIPKASHLDLGMEAEYASDPEFRMSFNA